MNALEVRDLHKAFGGVRAVNGVTFDVPPGSLTALIGPNGAGKSTLFNLLTNLYPSDAGSVSFFGTSLARKTSDTIARLGLIRTFQTARVFAGMSVRENVLAGLHVDAHVAPWAHALGLRKARREERALGEHVDALLDALGIGTLGDRDAMALPLGSQKIVELARALVSRPKLLLLDEPAAGLNDTETAELARLLLAVHRSGTTVFVVEHNMSLVMGIADRILVLDAGTLIANGTPADIRADRAVLEAYVGRTAAAEAK
ncbi:MAG: ABC transporter ATP-binding protein [Candidatus Velthaea sp.]